MSVLTTCIYRTIVMQSGEQFTLPPGGEVIAVTDNAAVTSSCVEELPEEALVCYYFQYEYEGPGSGGSDAWENAFIEKLVLGSTTYTINVSGDDPLNAKPVLDTVPTMLGAVYSTSGSVGDMVKCTITFQSIASIADNMLLYFHSSDGTYVQQKPRICP